jgi:hypothetical protein
MIDDGLKAPVVYDKLGLTRYCCKYNLENPSQLPPGLIYHNPRHQPTKFASQKAAGLLGQYSVSVTPYSGSSQSSRVEIAAPVSLSIRPINPPQFQTTEIKETDPGKSQSGLLPVGVTIGSEPAPEAITGTGFEITADYLPSELNDKIKKSLEGTRTSRAGIRRGGTRIGVADSGIIPGTIIRDQSSTAPLPIQPISQLDILSAPPVIRQVNPSETRHLFLPVTITRPSLTKPGEMVTVRQFSGI